MDYCPNCDHLCFIIECRECGKIICEECVDIEMLMCDQCAEDIKNL